MENVLETKLNLTYLTFLLKELYQRDLPIFETGTSYVKPSKSFVDLNMSFKIQNDRGLNKEYKPVHYKRVMGFVYKDTKILTDYENAKHTHLFVFEIICDLKELWEYKEGKDVITLTESNYKIIETTNLYNPDWKIGKNKGAGFIEEWFEKNIPVIADYLE